MRLAAVCVLDSPDVNNNYCLISGLLIKFCSLGQNKITIMKTKLTLTILGAYNMLFGVLAMFASSAMAAELVNSENADVIRMGEIFHIGLGHAIFLSGLILIFARKAELAVAKNIILAYIIGIAILFYIFFGVMANEPLILFSATNVVPDFVFFGVAVFGYLNAK